MSPKKDEQKENPGNSKPAGKGQRLPILWETINTFSRIIITLLGVAVAVISYFSGSSFLMSAIRAGAAVLGAGLILWVIYWMVVKGSISMMKDLAKQQADAGYHNSSTEYRA